MGLVYVHEDISVAVGELFTASLQQASLVGSEHVACSKIESPSPFTHPFVDPASVSVAAFVPDRIPTVARFGTVTGTVAVKSVPTFDPWLTTSGLYTEMELVAGSEMAASTKTPWFERSI